MKATTPDPTPPTTLLSSVEQPDLLGEADHKITRRFLRAAPLAIPQPPLGLTRLRPLERSTETLRFSVARFEFWLSPGGHLRECLRLGLWLWCVLTMIGVFVAPAVTYLLTQATTWTGLLARIVHNLMLLPLGIGTFLLSLAGLLLVWRVLFRR